MLNRPDIPHLREKFNQIDKSNKAALREWFTSQPYYTTNDFAQIADVSTKAIRRYKKSVGLGEPNKKQISKHHNPPPIREIIEIPPNWRTNAEWLQSTVKKYNKVYVARVLNVSRIRLITILKKLNIFEKANLKDIVKSTNPYCTYEWCYHQYIILGNTAAQCARLAGINRQTFADWLNRFSIPARQDPYIPPNKNNLQKLVYLWCRKLYHQLENLDIVSKVYPREGYIHVRYHSFCWDNYYFGETLQKVKQPWTYYHINERNAIIKNIPKIYNEYEPDIATGEKYDAHIAINRREIRKSSLIERRIAAHQFTKMLISRNWIQPKFPPHIIKTDMENVRNANLEKYETTEGFTCITNNATPIGQKTMLHYFDSSTLWTTVRSARKIIRYVNYLMDRPRTKFNYTNLLLLVSNNTINVTNRYDRIKIQSVPVYLAIFKKLNITGTVMDIKVGMGNRAIACAGLGLTYTTPDKSIEFALGNGLCEATNLIYEPYVGQNVDVIIYDEGFTRPIFDNVKPYIGKCKRLLVFVPSSCKTEMMQYKPKKMIKVRTRLLPNQYDYIMIW